MQRVEGSSGDRGLNLNNNMISSSNQSQNQRNSYYRQNASIGNRFATSFDSQSILFPSQATLPSSVSFTPSPRSCNEEMNVSATENRLYLARLTLEYQDIVDRYTLCLRHLEEAADEAELLRQENVALRTANQDLLKRLSGLAEASLQNRYLSSGYPPSLSIINDFRSLCIGDNGRNSRRVSDVHGPVTSPTSVIGSSNNRSEQKRVPERVSLPKSISVRSSGYLKMHQPAPSVSANAAMNTTASPNVTARLRVGTPITNTRQQQQQQRVYVAAATENKEDDPLEFDVYNQGMVKTELCNKWQETGACPYGDNCQFAHGIGELRPVIRHPRYKTEVCRMVLSGDICPYGHRCHFRHALTEQERRFRASVGGGGAN